jgi:hypothetical protein
MAQSTRSAKTKSDQEIEDQQSPQPTIQVKLTSPHTPHTRATTDEEDAAKQFKPAESPSQQSKGSLNCMEKKMDDLQATLETLMITLSTLTTKEETRKANKTLDDSLVEMKKELLDKQIGVFGDINSKFETKISEIEAKIEVVEKKESDQDEKVKTLQTKLLAEQYKVALLQTQLEEMKACPVGTTDIQNQIEELRDMILTKNEAQDKDMKDTMLHLNNLEAHGRRWALRIVGLPAPTTDFEKSDATKEIILQFCKDKLEIRDIVATDIDSAHRLGEIKEGKQTIIMRFFARDVVDYLLRNKTRLKNSNIMLFEDMSYKDRTLLHALKERTLEVESAWYLAGKIWAKLRSGRKIHVTIIDDLNTVLRGKGKPRKRKPYQRNTRRSSANTSPKEVETGEAGLPKSSEQTSTSRIAEARVSPIIAALPSTPPEQSIIVRDRLSQPRVDCGSVPVSKRRENLTSI